MWSQRSLAVTSCLVIAVCVAPMCAQGQPSIDDVERYFETRDARVYYSWIVRTMMEATSAARPVAQGYAFLVGNIESLSVGAVTGAGPAVVAKEVGKEALFLLTKDLIDHPEKLSMEIANQLMDEGMREYRENYRLYKKWESGEVLSKQEKQAFLDRRNPLERFRLGRDLFADVQKHKYEGTEREQVRNRLVGELAKIEDMSSAWDAVTTLNRLRVVVEEASSSLEDYAPYQRHVDRVSRSSGQRSIATVDPAGTVATHAAPATRLTVTVVATDERIPLPVGSTLKGQLVTQENLASLEPSAPHVQIARAVWETPDGKREMEADNRRSGNALRELFKNLGGSNWESDASILALLCQQGWQLVDSSLARDRVIRFFEPRPEGSSACDYAILALTSETFTDARGSEQEWVHCMWEDTNDTIDGLSSSLFATDGVPAIQQVLDLVDGVEAIGSHSLKVSDRWQLVSHDDLAYPTTLTVDGIEYDASRTLSIWHLRAKSVD